MSGKKALMDMDVQKQTDVLQLELEALNRDEFLDELFNETHLGCADEHCLRCVRMMVDDMIRYFQELEIQNREPKHIERMVLPISQS